MLIAALLALSAPVNAQDDAAPASDTAEEPPAAEAPPAEQEVLLPPDEELAPDDLFFDDESSTDDGSAEGTTDDQGATPSGEPSAEPGEGAASAPSEPSAADELEAEALGLDEGLAEPAPPTEPDPSVDPAATAVAPEQRTTAELSTAATIGLIGCGALAAVGAVIGVVANPVVATLMVFNAFAPAIALPLCGGALVINQTLAAAAGWAMCVAAPAPTVVAAGAGVAGSAGQVAVTKPWIPLGAAALGAIPGVLVGLLAGVVVLGGVAYGLSLEHLDVDRLQGGDVEVVYLTLPRAITGAVVALVGAILGVVAAPLAGGGAVGIGYTVAGLEAVDEEEAAVVAERPAPARRPVSLVEVSY